MKRIIEIRAGEGGQDSQLFIHDLHDAYVRLINSHNWKYTLLSSSQHLIKFSVSGKDVSGLDNEAGGHRIQRIPPTEKRGRVHTSTVTVAVIDPSVTPDTAKYDLLEEDHFRVEWFSGTGKGGQHRNKKQCSCRVIHIPTGIVESRQGRSRENNLRDAKQGIFEQLTQQKNALLYAARNDTRSNQVGTGQRADKIRTYRFQDDVVTDHISGKRAACKKVMKGKIDLLW